MSLVVKINVWVVRVECTGGTNICLNILVRRRVLGLLAITVMRIAECVKGREIVH